MNATVTHITGGPDLLPTPRPPTSSTAAVAIDDARPRRHTYVIFSLDPESLEARFLRRIQAEDASEALYALLRGLHTPLFRAFMVTRNDEVLITYRRRVLRTFNHAAAIAVEYHNVGRGLPVVTIRSELLRQLVSRDEFVSLT